MYPQQTNSNILDTIIARANLENARILLINQSASASNVHKTFVGMLFALSPAQMFAVHFLWVNYGTIFL
jgi:hypothetical protein